MKPRSTAHVQARSIFPLAMLREIPGARQHPGEQKRRWFFCHEQDLYVWQDDNDQITAIQLCYGKPHSEHAFYWRSDRGFSHLRVDGDRRYATPFLVANGALVTGPLQEEFKRLGAELPEEIRKFVLDRLDEYRLPPQPIQLQSEKQKSWWRFW